MTYRLQNINSALSNTPKQNHNQHRVCLESNSSTQHPARRIMCVVIRWLSADCSLHTSCEFMQCSLVDFKGGCQTARVEKFVLQGDCGDCAWEKLKRYAEAFKVIREGLKSLKRKAESGDDIAAHSGFAGPILSGFEMLSNQLETLAHKSWFFEGKNSLLDIEAEARRPARNEESFASFLLDYDVKGSKFKYEMKQILDAARDEMIQSCEERGREFFESKKSANCTFKDPSTQQDDGLTYQDRPPSPSLMVSMQPNTKREIILATRSL
ncbi:hypothetical protein LZ554_004621 [Drepanopeziza brunnea f. sp. 'monogermtubi']|nr:hypothetical protein LZ554_004621 [Drepanopeziza brunnea f. sp. 'monogermtubi']